VTNILAAVQLNLLVGPMIPLPVPLLVQALTEVVVNSSDTAPSGFQLTFHAERSTLLGLVDDPLLLGGPFSLLAPNNRVILTALVNGFPQVLIDGFIAGQVYNPSPEGSTLTVYGDDVSMKMDQIEMSMDWPYMPDFVIATALIAKYAWLGIVPMVIPTPTSVVPRDYMPRQTSTDLRFLQQLAGENGCTFCIRPGLVPGTGIGYWGPPLRVGTDVTRFGLPQKALSVDMGPFTNVESISFDYNAQKPQITYGAVIEDGLPTPLPVATMASLRLPPLALYQPLFNPLTARWRLLEHQGRDYIETLALAQVATDVSSDDTVTAKGTVDTVRYGALLQAPGLVGVRGAGLTYDGLYYIKSVTHTIKSKTTDWEYKQDFVLTREGIMTNVPGVLP
jgi:hypothetical protein